MKAWWKSKTIWVNTLGAAVEIGQLLMQAQILPPGTITLVLAGANVVLRKLTTQPIGATDQP